MTFDKSILQLQTTGLLDSSEQPLTKRSSSTITKKIEFQIMEHIKITMSSKSHTSHT